VKRTTNRNKTPRPEFIRKTVTIPGELEQFIEERRKLPENAGNFSGYVTRLIVKDKGEQLQNAA